MHITAWSLTRQMQVERRTGKVRRSKTDILPLCHATNLYVLYRTLSALDLLQIFRRAPVPKETATLVLAYR